MNRRKFLASFALTALALSPLAGCQWPWESPPGAGPTPTPGGRPVTGPEGPVDGYVAVAPRILRSGQSETVSVSLLNGRNPGNATVQVALLKDGKNLAQSDGYISGRGELALAVPALAEGDYQLQLSGRNIQATTPVRVEEGTLIFLETDKPIYKPGQTIHIRSLTLDPALKPVAGTVTVEVLDAKGLKIFKRDVAGDDFGMASLDLPLSTEPNLGVWKLTAKAGKRSAQLDVRVERYVLPKYEVVVDLAKEWVLVNEPIKGTIGAEYSYGKPVTGTVEIKATRYVGSWQEFARVSRDIVNGKVDFDLPAAGYVAGVPASGGQGNVQLDVTVREKSTEYEEKTSRLLTVAPSPLVLKVIPDSVAFKPSLPLSLLVVAESPDHKPANADVNLNVVYTKKDFNSAQENRRVGVTNGKAILKITPPADAISLTVAANSANAYTSLVMQAGYSPTGSFIHLEQVSQGTLKVGDTITFQVTSTKEAANFYYEVVARGKVVFSDYSRTPAITFTATPLMAPSARLLVYQVLPTSEVAADYLPFSVEGDYPQKIQVGFAKEEVKPGEEVDVNVQTEGPAKVGLAVVDRSVFILAENRLNLQQVFAELENLYQKPQAELHEARPMMENLRTQGAKEVFQDAGVVVLSNKTVPDGKQYENQRNKGLLFGAVPTAAPAAAPQAAAPADAARVAESAAVPTAAAGAGGLAEVQRVRQFFPETWIWSDLTTDGAGKASKRFTAPDSITTWMLRAVALSKAAGLGIGEAELRVFQPFFVQIDLPYSVIRGEQFPVKVALYNYTDQRQEFTVELDRADWFNLVGGSTSQRVSVDANDVGGASFTISPGKLGTNQVKVTARSATSADAIIKDLIVEPEGVAREEVENLVLAAGARKELALDLPPEIVEGSARGYVAVTGNYLTQSIQGLEKLLQMPFGCGEQNMILFAPNVFVTRYLKETGQMKPEVMAKAETLMVTGYQRELTYRRSDASFSAFGNQDKDGSLWLTAFVLKTFAQAKDVIYIDDSVLTSARGWVTKQQRADGSFEAVGFIHHPELLGGLQGKTPLTAYVAVALKEAGDDAAFAKAVRYLEGALDATDDPYAVAITAYALALGKSGKSQAAHDKLMQLAHESDGGLYWGSEQPQPLPQPANPAQPGAPAVPVPGPGLLPPRQNRSAAVETTAYAMLALLTQGDSPTAARAARWLVAQRNAYGGYGSTQDTVVGLQALTSFAANSRSDVDATITLQSGNWNQKVRVSPADADVLRLVEVPLGGNLSVSAEGKGQVVLQTVRRYNLPDAAQARQSVFQLDVQYGVDQVAVNDLITVTATVKFTPPEPMQAGMVVLDVAVPTGFAAVEESLAALTEQQAKLKRFEVAGRKVILYIEDMQPEEQLQFSFQARALYPVKAQAVASQAYAYYRPEWQGESLGGAVVVQ